MMRSFLGENPSCMDFRQAQQPKQKNHNRPQSVVFLWYNTIILGWTRTSNLRLRRREFSSWTTVIAVAKIKGNLQKSLHFPTQTTSSFYIILCHCQSGKPLFGVENRYFLAITAVKPLRVFWQI